MNCEKLTSGSETSVNVRRSLEGVEGTLARRHHDVRRNVRQSPRGVSRFYTHLRENSEDLHDVHDDLDGYCLNLEDCLKLPMSLKILLCRAKAEA